MPFPPPKDRRELPAASRAAASQLTHVAVLRSAHQGCDHSEPQGPSGAVGKEERPPEQFGI